MKDPFLLNGPRTSTVTNHRIIPIVASSHGFCSRKRLCGAEDCGALVWGQTAADPPWLADDRQPIRCRRFSAAAASTWQREGGRLLMHPSPSRPPPVTGHCIAARSEAQTSPELNSSSSHPHDHAAIAAPGLPRPSACLSAAGPGDCFEHRRPGPDGARPSPDFASRPRITSITSP